MEPIKNTTEWHKIGDKLTSILGICHCQRKLKSFVDILVSIHNKCNVRNWDALTMEELFICAFLDKLGILCHGTNCEYPIVAGAEAFWEWIFEIKDSPYLQDN